MNTFQTIIVIALGGNAVIGLLVWMSNPQRRLNRYFLLTIGLIAWWLLCMFAITLQSSDNLLFWTRQVSAAAAFLPLGFFILRLVIIEPELTFVSLCGKIRYLLLAGFLIAVLCQTSFFARSTYFAQPLETVPASDYGPGFYIYILYFIAMVAYMLICVAEMFRVTVGVQRTESQFLLLGWLVGFSFGLMLFIAANLMGTQEATRFLPLFALILDGFVAYGIATRRILSVSVVLQRLTAYALLVVYLVGVYVISEWLFRYLFYLVLPDTTYLSHLLAALVVAFSVVPAHGWMHVFSRRILSTPAFSVDDILARAGSIFREMSTEEELMDSFSSLISETFETSRLVLLRPADGSGYVQCYPEPISGDMITLQLKSRVVQLLKRDHEPFAVDTLERMRPTELVTGALAEMQSADAAIAVGSFSHHELRSVLILSGKKSGRIYDLREQQALQLLSDQLAVAIENARLYTEVQDGKIYNEILLDSLTSGIVAVNADRKVTVFNKRAQNLTGLAEGDVVGKPLDVLPPALADSVAAVLETDKGFRDRDFSIPVEDTDVSIRASGAVFHSHTGEMLGALLVFYDMTLLKKLEEQIRRADRLSSIGTLSAGMAHEIKNPLVTIKTFTQLLPNQYASAEFRDTFFDLVGQEVQRIDTIVNRLLNFARPAKALLKPVSLHEVVENSLRLVEQQLAQNRISLEVDLNAKNHMIEGDAEQLNQIFINFFLNAIHAMAAGGTLSVRTSVFKSTVRLEIEDSGIGIPADKLQHIFDPFFTTKVEGSGLGLAVAHGIIMEHGATVDVESTEGKGTTFHLQFPLLKTGEGPGR